MARLTSGRDNASRGNGSPRVSHAQGKTSIKHGMSSIVEENVHAVSTRQFFAAIPVQVVGVFLRAPHACRCSSERLSAELTHLALAIENRPQWAFTQMKHSYTGSRCVPLRPYD